MFQAVIGMKLDWEQGREKVVVRGASGCQKIWQQDVGYTVERFQVAHGKVSKMLWECCSCVVVRLSDLWGSRQSSPLQGPHPPWRSTWAVWTWEHFGGARRRSAGSAAPLACTNTHQGQRLHIGNTVERSGRYPLLHRESDFEANVRSCLFPLSAWSVLQYIQ